MQSAHDFHVQGLQRVTRGLDEIDAGVDPVVDNVHSVDFVLSVEICIKTLLDVLDDWTPGLCVVHKVSKARRVNHGESQTHAILLNVGADGLDCNCAWRKIETWLFRLLWWI